MEDLFEREEELIMPTADCGRDDKEVDFNEINVDFGANSDEHSDEEEKLKENASKNLSQGKQKWYIKRNAARRNCAGLYRGSWC